MVGNGNCFNVLVLLYVFEIIRKNKKEGKSNGRRYKISGEYEEEDFITL